VRLISFTCARGCAYPTHFDATGRSVEVLNVLLVISINGRALFIALRPLCFTSIYGRARASARSDHYVFALFFRIPFFFFFFFFFFFIFFVCRQLIMSKASAYGDEIWQVDSLPQNADRMFISLKSLKGFARGRGEGPQNSIGGSVSITGE
jgi:hypothetical protein